MAVSYLWVGAVTTTGATVATKTTGSNVRLAVSTASNMASPVYGSSVAVSSTLAKPTITGLSANTSYWYQIEIDGVLDTSKTGQFKTAPSGQTSFTFGFSSCHTTGGASTAYTRILARNPALFIITGDLHYEDPGTQAAFNTGYDTQLTSTGMGDLTRTVPTTYTWSDHDWSSDNNGAESSAMNATANSTYRNRVPHWPLGTGGTKGIYQTFTWGRVRFIVTDERSYKSDNTATDNSSKTMLGATQKQWLKDTITNATEPLIFWAGDTPWNGAAATPDDEWFAYNTERQELATFFSGSGKNIVRLSGDMHAVAADDGTNSPGGIPILHAAPLFNTFSNKGGPYTSGPYPTSGASNLSQYGFVTITDNGSTIDASFVGYDSSDVSRATWSDSYAATPARLESLWSASAQATTQSPGTPASGTGSLSLSGAAAGRGAATASGSLSLSGTGAARGAAVASATLSLSGTAGSQAAAPAASGALSLSGTASARGAAVASGSLSLSGTAPSRAAAPAAAGALTLAGTATLAGAGAAVGTAALSLSGTAGAQGGTPATGALSLSGTASAQGRAVASGALTLSGAGSTTTQGSASGSLSLSGSGGTSRAVLPAAAGSLTLAGAGALDGSSAATATGFITLIGSTPGFISGASPATGSISIVGSSGARGVASASGSLSLSGAGTTAGVASATGSIALSGTGNILTTPTAGGTLSLSGTSTSSRGGSPASGALSLSGSAGASVPLWVVTGTLSLSGTASARAVATAAGSLSLVGNASTTGSFPASGTGEIALTGTAAGRASASGTGVLSLAGVGGVPATPTGSGTLLISGTAAGLTGGNVAPGSITLTGTAGARATTGGTASLTLSGTAGVGTISPASGTGILSLSGTATASGRASSATGALAVSGTASARATVLPVGQLTLSGTANAQITTSASGALSLVGGSATTVVATASGSIELNGYVILVPAPVLVRPVARLRPNTARATLRRNARASLIRDGRTGP